MKTTFNKVLQAAVAATVLTFAGVSHAADIYTNQSPTETVVSIDAAGAAFFGQDREFNGKLQIGVSVYEMFNTGKPSQQYLAYCIEPAVTFWGGDYTATYNTQPAAKVRQLYESSFASTLGNTSNQVAFQLALWELAVDDGNLSTGDQKYVINSASPAEFHLAETMLLNARSTSLAVEHYNYVTFNQTDSQTLLGVSAVPEADTWAMMALGLGMLGLVGRRQQKNEKFA